jgi:hypothetical protein
MYHSAENYWGKKSPAFNFFAAVPFGFTADELFAWVQYGGGHELWDALSGQFNVKSLLCGNTGCQAASPLAARAQQRGASTVGFLHSLSPEAIVHVVAAFRSGLAETSYVEGSNVLIEYRWARGNFDQLPAYAAELVALRVAVTVAAGSTVSALAAKAQPRLFRLYSPVVTIPSGSG